MLKNRLSNQNNDKIERFDYAEIWMRDGLSVVKPGDFFQSLEVDMSHSKTLIETLRKSGVKATYTHVFVRATAMVLSKHPNLHQLISEKQRITPGQVDIGLSIAGTTVVAPVMVIENAGCKTIETIANEIIKRTPEVKKEQEQMLSSTRKWGWMIPWGWLRRWILHKLIKQPSFRRKGNGTFQVSCLTDVDQFVPFLFTTSAILGTGRVRDRVVAVKGTVEIRPTTIICCCADHKAWDGILAAKFLKKVKEIIESGEIEE